MTHTGTKNTCGRKRLAAPMLLALTVTLTTLSPLAQDAELARHRHRPGRLLRPPWP